MLHTKVTSATKKSEVKKKWLHIDANGKVLGRLASEIVTILMGKDKPNYAPYLDGGNNIVVTNAKQIIVTGNKELGKIYYRHSGKVGNLRMETVEKLREHNPRKILFNAVKGMLPKNRLRDVRLGNLKIYEGENHPHSAQVNANTAKKSEAQTN